uniref:Putative secreted protein n=1 Tax=Ixodes ricinus TaxID=34613 RepID=A0A6B0UUS6_IXORI
MKTSKKWTSGITSASACSLLFFSLSLVRSRSILSKAMSISMNSRSRSSSSPSLRENLSISSFQACSRSKPPITLFTVAIMSQSHTTNCSFSSRCARFTPEGPSPLAPSESPPQSTSLLRAESVIPLPSPNASAALFFLRFPLSP